MQLQAGKNSSLSTASKNTKKYSFSKNISSSNTNINSNKNQAKSTHCEAISSKFNKNRSLTRNSKQYDHKSHTNSHNNISTALKSIITAAKNKNKNNKENMLKAT